MSKITPKLAREMVEARLGRSPQDALEAAVVLEAWAGIRPDAALKLGERAVAVKPRSDDGRASGRRASRPDKALLAEGAALLIAVIAVALWTQPFGDALGSAAWDGAVRIALPVTLGLQWLLRSRYLGRKDGLSSMQRAWLKGQHGRGGSLMTSLRSTLLVVVVVEGAALMLGMREFVAVLLILTWVSGPIIVRRGWGLAYVLLLVGVSVAVNAGVEPLRVLFAAAALTTLGSVLSLVTVEAGHEAPGRLSRAAAAGLMGGAIGAMLVIDTTIGWGTTGALPAIALVPSAIGSFWGGIHLWRLHEQLPRALTGVPVADADRLTFRSPAMGALNGAVLRLVVVTAVLSMATLAVRPYVSGTSTAQGSDVARSTSALTAPAPAREGIDARSRQAMPAYAVHGRSAERSDARAGEVALLLGFGLLALATLLISLLQSLGYPWRALLSVFCGVAAEVAVVVWGGAPVPGAALVLGALVAVMVALPATIGLCLRPGRVLATTMWIQ